MTNTPLDRATLESLIEEARGKERDCQRIGESGTSEEWSGTRAWIEGKLNAPPKEPLVCERTGNPCGTDTWAVGVPCNCTACKRWLEQQRLASSAQQSGPPATVSMGWTVTPELAAPRLTPELATALKEYKAMHERFIRIHGASSANVIEKDLAAAIDALSEGTL
jgi:hypothetical protein